MFEVKKAKRQRRPLKIGLEGLSGSGKTFTALRLAFAMRRAGIGKRIVVADSENESAGLYDGIDIDGERWEYDVCPLPVEHQHPAGYAACYDHLVKAGYDIVIVDSMTHAWRGALNRVDEIAARNKNDKFGTGWRVVTPEQEHMMRALTDARAHVITTTRVKAEYERTDGANGKEKIRKVGLKADQRDGAEYEYDCVVRLDPEGHLAVVEKVRGCTAMDGRAGQNPGPEFWQPLFDWWLSADTPEDAARKAFTAAVTLEGLVAAWNPLPPAVKERVAADKDRRKAELAPAAISPHPVAPTDTELAALHDRLAAASDDLSTTPDRLFAAYYRQVGPWQKTDPLPPVGKLPVAQLTRLVDIAERAVAAQGAAEGVDQ